MRLLPNPTSKRLAWVAKTYPAPVLYDVIEAFAEATALHTLESDIRSERDQWTLASRGPVDPYDTPSPLFGPSGLEVPIPYLYPARALEHVAYYTRASGRPELAQDRSRYDRYFPWAAATLNRAHKAVLKSARESVARDLENYLTEGKGTRTHGQEARLSMAAQALAAAPDLDSAAPLVELVVGEAYINGRPSKHGDLYYRRARSDYRRAAAAMTMNFAGIVDWAEAEQVDLGGVSLYMAIKEAENYAKRVARAQEEAEVPEGRIVYQWPDGWTVRELLTTRELVIEGNVLRHCVKSYTEGDLVIGGGESRVYSLRDPENRPVVTMEWLTDERRVPASGLRGFANQVPELVELSRLLEFRMACEVFHPRWEDVSRLAAWPGDMPLWQGRYRRWLGQDDQGQSRYAVVEVFDAAVYPHVEVEVELARQIEDAGERAYDEAEREWAPYYTDADALGEKALEAAAAEQASVVTHFDPGGHINRHDFDDLDGQRSDLSWVLWLRQGHELMLAKGDEMIDWLDRVRGDNVLLPGFASRDVARHPAFLLTPPTRLVAPDRFGLARRMSPEGELTEWELHPAGKPVAHWCQASDFVDDPTG
jgi:hypothetical protein